MVTSEIDSATGFETMLREEGMRAAETSKGGPSYAIKYGRVNTTSDRFTACYDSLVQSRNYISEYCVLRYS